MFSHDSSFHEKQGLVGRVSDIEAEVTSRTKFQVDFWHSQLELIEFFLH